MSQLPTNDNYTDDDQYTYATQESFPFFDEPLVEPLAIGGLGVQLIGYYTPVRGAKSSTLQLPLGFTMQEFHSPKEEELPQEQGLEIGYVRELEISR